MNTGLSRDYSDTNPSVEDEEVAKANLFINIWGTDTTLNMGEVDIGDDRSVKKIRSFVTRMISGQGGLRRE